MEPAVSVIIPVFNREGFICDCVESVLAQSYSDYELIVVDDGSEDRSVERLAPYRDRLRLIRQKQRGPSAARNNGMRHARGQWLTFLDSDDLWLPQKLAVQMDFIQRNPDSRICYTEEIWYRGGRRVNPGKRHRKYSGWIYRKMLPLCLISPSSVMLHRSVLDRVGPFDEDLPACEDYDLWLRIAVFYPIALIDEPLIIKQNGHPGQLSQQFWGMDRFRLRALVKLLESGSLAPQDEAATRRLLVQKCRILASGCRRRDKSAEAERYDQMAARYGPKPLNWK